MAQSLLKVRPSKKALRGGSFTSGVGIVIWLLDWAGRVFDLGELSNLIQENPEVFESPLPLILFLGGIIFIAASWYAAWRKHDEPTETVVPLAGRDAASAESGSAAATGGSQAVSGGVRGDVFSGDKHVHPAPVQETHRRLPPSLRGELEELFRKSGCLIKVWVLSGGEERQLARQIHKVVVASGRSASGVNSLGGPDIEGIIVEHGQGAAAKIASSVVDLLDSAK